MILLRNTWPHSSRHLLLLVQLSHLFAYISFRLRLSRRPGTSRRGSNGGHNLSFMCVPNINIFDGTALQLRNVTVQRRTASGSALNISIVCQHFAKTSLQFVCLLRLLRHNYIIFRIVLRLGFGHYTLDIGHREVGLKLSTIPLLQMSASSFPDVH